MSNDTTLDVRCSLRLGGLSSSRSNSIVRCLPPHPVHSSVSVGTSVSQSEQRMRGNVAPPELRGNEKVDHSFLCHQNDCLYHRVGTVGGCGDRVRLRDARQGRSSTPRTIRGDDRRDPSDAGLGVGVAARDLDEHAQPTDPRKSRGVLPVNRS